jgi:hypothetical protein
MDGLGIIVALFALTIVGISFAVGLMACAALVVLVSLGVVSSSVIVGFWKRRTLAGVHAFFVQCGVLAGAPTGAVCAWVISRMWPSVQGDWHVLLAGSFGGAAGGLLIAWLASTAAAHIAKHAWPWLKGRVTLFRYDEAEHAAAYC